MLVNCIRRFLHDLVGPFQSSFLRGRGACDNAIIALEIFHHMNKTKRKKGFFVIKVDLHKV